MISAKAITWQRLLDAVYAVGAIALSLIWAGLSDGRTAYLAAAFACCLLAARFLVASVRGRYLLGATALGLLAWGQLTQPLSFLQLPHIAFNLPFLSALLYAEIWPGIVLGTVLSALFYFSFPQETGILHALIGVSLMSLLVHSLAYLISRLVGERAMYKDLSDRLRREIEQEYAEKEKVKEKLYTLDRLNIVGEMAASIGHEVRNPLTTVRGYLQYFQGKSGFAENQAALRLMIEELDRANMIISEFLALAKNKRTELRPGNLSAVLEAIRPMLEAGALHMGHQFQLSLTPTPDLIIDESEIRQLIMNLVRNGLEAMTTVGRLTVATYTDNDTGAICLAVSDTGSGIPEAVLAKVGMPFFTTKEKGTGLGLAICHRIAERHGATLDISTSRQGTRITVRFAPPLNKAANDV